MHVIYVIDNMFLLVSIHKTDNKLLKEFCSKTKPRPAELSWSCIIYLRHSEGKLLLLLYYHSSKLFYELSQNNVK